MSSSSFGVAPDAKSGRPAIRVDNVSKHYVMFERPEDRFKQMVVPRLQRLIGQPPKRYYRDFAALNGVSLEVGRGETVGIIGRNGSGKSTLLQIICGTLRPTSGSVEVNGRIAALLELGAGFNPEFTGRENVFLNGQILGVSRQEMEWRFDDIARFADIGSFIDQPVKTYSSGMYVRLAFATAINVDPDILVVDEALSVGDEAFQRKCFGRIEDIKDKGGTILFVSHGAQTIVQLCSRAVLMDAGEKILEGTPKLVIRQYQRLVNASAEAIGAIRVDVRNTKPEPSEEIEQALAVIQQEDSGSDTVESEFRWTSTDPTIDSAASPAKRSDSELVSKVTDSGTHAEFYDPSLISSSTVWLEERGVRLSDMGLFTLSGAPINTLLMGRRYRYEYTAAFSVDARTVGFGIWFRTVSGLGLGGGQTIFSPALTTKFVSAGSVIRVAYEFDNILLPGVYFISCGIFGTPKDERIVMHRAIDATAFRVASEPDLLSTGLVDFSPSISTKNL